MPPELRLAAKRSAGSFDTRDESTPTVHRRVREERPDLRGPHLARMLLAVEEDVAAGPVQVAVFHSDCPSPHPERVASLPLVPGPYPVQIALVLCLACISPDTQAAGGATRPRRRIPARSNRGEEG